MEYIIDRYERKRALQRDRTGRNLTVTNSATDPIAELRMEPDQINEGQAGTVSGRNEVGTTVEETPVPDPTSGDDNRVRIENQRVATSSGTGMPNENQQTSRLASRDSRRKKTVSITHAGITVAVPPDMTQLAEQRIEPVLDHSGSM